MAILVASTIELPAIAAEGFLKIKGMTCSSCVEAIEQKLKSLHGVEKVKVNLKKGRAQVTYDEKAIDLQKMTQEVNRLGYVATIQK